MRKGTKQRTFGTLEHFLTINWEPDQEDILTLDLFQYPFNRMRITLTKEDVDNLYKFLVENMEGVALDG